jgi:putative transposase
MTSSKFKSEMGEIKTPLIDQNDVLKHWLHDLFSEFIRSEFSTYIGAGEYERSENRQDVRNGSYQRHLLTRYGQLDLTIPRARDGKFQTQVFDRWQRSEQALHQVLSEMVVSGVSTRKVSEIVSTLTDQPISASTVSEWGKRLDKPLHLWRNRKLDQLYRYLIVDARYEKVRLDHRVQSCGFVSVIGISLSGHREILSTEVIIKEHFSGYRDLFRRLKEQGLTGVDYVVSDDHDGLRQAIQSEFPQALWQRCQVHYLRNFSGKLPSSITAESVSELQRVFAASSKQTAIGIARELVDRLHHQHSKVADWLSETIEDTLQVFDLPEEHRKRMKSTNLIERLNQELKRRSRVVRIFPNTDSVQRLLGTICMNTSDQWLTNGIYLNFKCDKNTEY